MNGYGNGNDQVREVTLTDDDRVSPGEALASIGAVQARVGDNIATDTSTSKYGPRDGPKMGAVRIGGIAGYAEGDILTRFDGATGYDETSKMGGVATGQGVIGAAEARQLAERVAGQGTWEYRLDPAYRLNADGVMTPLAGQNAIVFAPEDRAVSRSTVSDRYGIIQPSDWDAAMDTICSAVGEKFGETPRISRNMLWSDRSLYMVQSAPLPKGIRLPSGGDLELRLMALGGFDGTRGGQLLLDGRVPACRNVLQGIMNRAKLRWPLRHVGDATGRLALAAEVLALQMTERLPLLENTIASMGTRTVTDRALAVTLALVFGNRENDGTLTFSSKASNAARRILRAYTDAPGALPGTQWGAYQAATHFATHEHAGKLSVAAEERVYTLAASKFDDKFLTNLDKAYALEQTNFQGSTAEEKAENLVYQTVSLATFA